MKKYLYLSLFVFSLLILQSRLSFGERMISPYIDLDNEPFDYFKEPITVLGVKDGEEGTEVTPEGTLYTGSAELLFFAGSYPYKIEKRVKRLDKGYLPIVSYKYFYDDISYYFQMFANTLDGNPQSNLINFVKVKVKNETKELKKAYFWTGICFKEAGKRFEPHKEFNKDWIYEIKDNLILRNGKLLYTFSEDERIDKFITVGKRYEGAIKGSDLFILEKTPVCLARYSFCLQPDEEKDVYIKMPYFPVEDKDEIKKIKDADYEEYFTQTVNFWEDLLSRGVKISLSEKKVVDTFKTSLIYDLIARDKVGEEYIQKVNEFQYDEFWLRDSSFIVRAYDLCGHHKIAKETVLHFLKYQRADGNFVSQGGQFDGWGQTLWAFGQHYNITGDKEFAREVYPYVKKAVKWLKDVRGEDKFNIMPETAPGDNELIKGHITGHNFWALLGLRCAIYLSEAVGNKEDRDEFKDEYKDFHNSFMKRLREVTKGTGGYIPPGLDGEGGQDWGNLIGVYPSEVLKPDDLMVTSTLKEVKKKFREGIMTYFNASSLHHYLTEYVTQTEVIRGEQRPALEGFYSLLSHASSTNAGFEWGIPPWGSRDFGRNFSPHGWFAAKYIALLRNMLVREEGNNLHLLSCISPQWLKEKIIVEDAPTNFGKISLSLSPAKDKGLLKIKANYRRPPDKIIIYIPFFVKAKEAFADGKKVSLKEDKLTVSPDTQEVKIIWNIEKLEDLNYESFVLKYKEEYRKRYGDYLNELNEGKFKRSYER
ncbi:MAG: hypothetical protein COS84_07295 [Armatimonadetes bacterium CG07_land_8_20_14_0_80_40_9]|nr:MAG: hypothetical protein COS84_07295 [Armatimonadetes bacterium CG07_land_8_20_14_0_80_40_9]